MSLVKQSVNVNFSQGLDTKTDSKQVQLGKFLSLKNSVFTKGGLLQKRNGYGSLTSLPDASTSYLTTFNGNLTAVGTSLQTFSSGNAAWLNKGKLQPISLSVLPVVRNALNQSQCDYVVASNNISCVVFTEVNNGVVSYKYAIQDAVLGQNIVEPTAIPVGSGTITGSPRVFLLGNNFIIVFTNVISSVSHLQYIAVSTINPTVVTANVDLAPSYVPASTLSWDGVVVGNNLYVAFNTTAGGQKVQLVYLTSSFALSAVQSFSGSKATMMSMCADTTSPSNSVIYAAFYDSGSTDGYCVAVDQNLNQLMTATQMITSTSVDNIACTAQSGVLQVAYEVDNAYGYDSSIPSHYLKKVSITKPNTVTTGTVGSTSTFLRSVGLASKGFLMNSTMYMLGIYQSTFQPTYFLFDINGNVISRFAYQNGGGYLSVGLPQAQVTDTVVSIPYLYKDLIQTTNTTSTGTIGSPNINNIYSQTGINAASLDFTSADLSTSEIGSNLNLSGGFLWAYDGQTINEQNFHLYPDSVEAAQVSDPTPTGTLSDVTNPTVITGLSSVAGIVPGMTVTDTTNPSAIPAGTTVVSVGSSTVTMSAAATAAHTGDSLKFVGAVSAQQYYYQAVYQWTDAQGNIFQSAPSIPVTVTASSGHTSVSINVPTLRLTYKPEVKIVLYRWSAAQQTYYQITSITAPTLNDTSVDYVTFVDIKSDAQILGNSILYTTGGVIENIAGPACTATTLFDDRLWLIDAEDPNLLWFSKQIIEGTPVEMSDLFTLYVAPSTGAQGSTGNMQCLFPLDDKLIIFKRDAIYYINGSGPDNTGANNGYSQPIFITSTVGCANQNSIVFMPNGLMFQSDKGIWLLGRDLNTTYIGAPVEQYNNYDVNSAVNIPGTNQVRFTLSNGVTLMFDYYYSQWGTFSGVPAVSSTLYQNLHTYVNSSGAVSQETPSLYLDNGNPVSMSFTTSWLNLNGLQGYQRSYFFYLLGQYITPHKLNVQIAYDYNPSLMQATLITPTNASPAYGVSSPYGQQDLYGGEGNVENWRVFLSKQRCTAFQITVDEIYDASQGVPAGAGLTLSGLELVVGAKKGYRPIGSRHSAGG